MRPVVVLYNPRAVFFTMPLALVAIGSALDRSRFDVRVVDARLERDPHAALLAALDGALCLGVTVLTGAPIADALAATRAARARCPALPVIWGGWHPSLFPAATLDESGADAVVVGQGEAAFAEIVDRLAAGSPLDGIPGCHPRGGGPGGARALADVNGFPAHDYGLLDVEAFFAAKGKRQLDMITSQGCRFRCTFCADPTVYRRGWTGLEPARVGAELAALHARFGFAEVGFQDETFFTSAPRVAAIAEELLRAGLGVTWTATMRADQGARLDAAVLATCRRAGLARVMIGVEAGAPEMLAEIGKDITLEQVFAAAEKCRRHRVGALFNFIVGFPGESDASVHASLEVAKRLRRMSPDFEVAVFYFKPYPGNPIAERLAASGYRFPASLAEWAAFDYVGSSGEWVGDGQRRLVEGFKFYQRLAWSRPRLLRAPLQALARWRCAHDAYAFPVEKAVVEWLRPPPRLS